ncbi:DUF5776 domain-containing protein [Levilactobacillus mulengensis]|uniref:DUF5776 domain-containing protein n=1 Tax=Levilactobacillus mulengensis TaxID=2486025 RepID=UPI000F7BAEEC|nr:DUF5776 domain-containing protein [Levilactobacillus mulengensis]
MKNRLWTIPFLLFSVTLIASINQPTINVSADSQDTSSVTAKVPDHAELSGSGVFILQPTIPNNGNKLIIDSPDPKNDTYPSYYSTDGSFAGEDFEIPGAKDYPMTNDTILINATTGKVFYGVFLGGNHADIDKLYYQYVPTDMTLNGATNPVKVTLNFYDSADPTHVIQTKTIESGIGADDPLFAHEITGLKGVNVPIKGYTRDTNKPATADTDSAKTTNTATVNYYYTNDSDANTPSDHPGTKTSGTADSTSSNVSNTSNTSSTTPATASSSSASLTTSGAADQADTTKASVVKGSAVYATQKISLYSKPTFTKATRAHWYTKQTRPNRPQFVVTGYARSNAGRLRYRVRSLDGRTGYITANANFVRNTYYHANPKTIRVIGNHGLNAYHKVNLSGKVRHYKRGTTLKIKRIEKHNLTTRLVLTNGTYITGNKTLVIKK